MNTPKKQLITLAKLAFLLSFFLLVHTGNVMAKEENAGRYAIVKKATSKVVNVIVLDPNFSIWSPPAGHIVIQSDVAGPGDIWDGTSFVKPTPEERQVVLQADGNDIAEYIKAAEESLLPGTLVAVHEEGMSVRKSNKPYDQNIVGVISLQPGLVLGQSENGIAVPLALTGRVPVKVSLENGPIAVGDSITSSSKPGVGMKATKPGRVVGIALEPYTIEPDVAGQIIILINPHWQGNDLSVQQDSSGQLVNLDPEQLRTGLASLGLVVNPNGTLAVDTLRARKVALELLEVKDRVTGNIYCTWLENGEWKKIQSDCDSFTISSSPTPVPAPAPQPSPEASAGTAEPTSTPVPEPTPTPESVSVLEPVAEPVAEPSPTPEPIGSQTSIEGGSLTSTPIVEPAPTPAPEPTPEPVPVAEPTPEPVQEPTPVSEPSPEPVPAPTSEPIVEPVAEAPIPSSETP